MMPKEMFMLLRLRGLKTRCIGVCVAWLFHVFSLSAQDNIRFQNLDINQGLSQSSVNCILQDEKGFIWMGTQDGLNRYDGFGFKVFRNDPENATTISNNYIKTACRSADGKIWVGTENGLNLFDPKKETVERFFATGKPGSLPGNKIASVTLDDKERLWVGTEGTGVAMLTPHGFRNYRLDGDGLNVRQIKTIANSGIWVSTTGGLFIFNEEQDKFERFAPAQINESWSVDADSNGVVWIGTAAGLFRATPVSGSYLAEEVDLDAFQGEFPGIRKVMVDGDQDIWLSTSGRGVIAFSQEEDKRVLHRYRHQEFNPYSILSDLVYDIYEDNGGVIWIGSKNGASRFDRIRQGFLHISQEYDNPNSLADNNIWCFQEDRTGRLFIGTRKGLSIWDQQKAVFKNYYRETHNINTPNDNSLLSLHIDSKNRFWAGFVDGLFKINVANDEVQFEKVNYRDSDPSGNDPRVYSIREDKKGRLWIGSRQGLGLLDPESGRYQFFQHEPANRQSISENLVRVVHVDSEGGVWIGTDGGGLNKVIEREGKIEFRAYKAESRIGFTSNSILSIWEEKPGILWLGTYGGGLIRFDYNKEKSMVFSEESHGIANDVVYGILPDTEYNLWLSTNKGLSRFNYRNYNVKNFQQKEGLQSNEFNIGAHHLTNDGYMLFGGLNGFNRFKPSQIRSNQNGPHLVITDFIHQNQSYRIGSNSIFRMAPAYAGEIEIGHTNNRFTIEFAALHFSDPEGNQYKYKLEGLESEFVYTSGSNRRANYSNLPPGKYTFIVYGANSDGVWSNTPAKLRIVIDAPYWKEGWFQSMLIFIALGAASFGFMKQVKEIRKQKDRLEAQVVERTREVIKQKEKIEEQTEELKKEKEKVESLLLNVLPEQTADELKSKGKAAARSYRRVSIMFTDFRNFTKLAEQFRPPELVARLDNYFSRFDDIISKYQLEKIKTIGDAYMCAGGVPLRNTENPIYTVLAALEIQEFMMHDRKERVEKNETPWELRIGINTGEVVAGVIGSKRFAYDVWGNAVNVAARMETASEPGKVNVSGKTFDLIEPFFECTYRGKIPAKNKGHIDMYFVERIKPELSVDGQGLTPSQAFWDYVNLHLFSSINYMKAERYIMKLLEKKLSPKLHYHSIAHTRDVTKAAERIALMEGVRGEDLFLLQTAATYHDAGFVEQYEANEPIGVKMAREILPKYGYSEEQIDVVAGLIYSTRIPHNPANHLQEIICDADLDYLGRDDFHDIADKLRIELREHGKINSDRLWDEVQVKFLTQHQYFTKSAIKLRQNKKERHIQEIKDRLAKGDYQD